MAVTRQRIEQLAEVRGRLGRAVADLEWAYRSLYYGNDEAPSLDRVRRQSEAAANDLLRLITQLGADVG
jgi:hypothetical protein